MSGPLNDSDAKAASDAIRERCEKLSQQIHNCLTTNRPAEVNLSLPKHHVLTQVLRRVAYDQSYSSKKGLPVVFLDGSRPPPFPVGTLITRPAVSYPKDRVINLGMCSFRHPDMDYLVDLYLTRNKDLNDQSSMAAAEELSYRRTVEFLRDSLLDPGGLVRVFHTGLEPMVVGFYRGVVEVLCERRDYQGKPANLRIEPFVFMKQSDQTNITPNSLGAQLASYDPAEPWQ